MMEDFQNLGYQLLRIQLKVTPGSGDSCHSMFDYSLSNQASWMIEVALLTLLASSRFLSCCLQKNGPWLALNA